MGGFHIALFHHCVMKGGIDLLMPQKPLYLLNRHSFVDCRGCHGPPEFVRMYVMDIAFFSHLPQDIALLFICNRITYRVPITDTYVMPAPYSRTNVGVQKLLADYEALLEKMSK